MSFTAKRYLPPRTKRKPRPCAPNWSRPIARNSPTPMSRQAKATLEEFEKLAAAGTTILEHANDKVEEVVSTLVETGDEIKLFASTGTSTLQSVNAKADTLLIALMDTSEQLSGTLAQMRLVLEKVNSGDGTAGKILNDGAFYENLLDNTMQLKALLEEMKAFIAEWRDKKIDVRLF